MTSAINPDNPVHGNPTTQSVRDNFQIAAQEISDLQALVAALALNYPYLPLGGATMTGPLRLAADPVADSEAATKAYVDLLETTITQLEERVAELEANSTNPRMIGSVASMNRAVDPLIMLNPAFQPLDAEIVDGVTVHVVGSIWPSVEGRSFTVTVANRPLSQFYLVGADTSAETQGVGQGAVIWLESTMRA
jgi:hypothetical protein